MQLKNLFLYVFSLSFSLQLSHFILDRFIIWVFPNSFNKILFILWPFLHSNKVNLYFSIFNLAFSPHLGHITSFIFITFFEAASILFSNTIIEILFDSLFIVLARLIKDNSKFIFSPPQIKNKEFISKFSFEANLLHIFLILSFSLHCIIIFLSS